MTFNQFFSTSFVGNVESTFSLADFLICVGVSLLLGLFIAFLYSYKTKHTKSFVTTLSILPAVVCMVIMMVNGNVGTGVAVAGAFSLVRFRSVPGTAKEIGALFLAMGTGLATGMGYVGFAIVFVFIISIVSLLLTISPFGESKLTMRTLTITIPEDLDYTGVFDDLFEKYTNEHTLNRVRTTNMGSLFKITYDIDLKSEGTEKEFIDQIRCRNGNLEIVMAKQAYSTAEL